MHGPSTTEQQRVARLLGVEVASFTESVAAAVIREQVAHAIGESGFASPSTEKQRAFADSLGVDVGGVSKGVASAKIDEALFLRNKDALRLLDLKPGDHVVKRNSIEFGGERRELTESGVVSSVSANLRVHFKGTGCRGAWPVELMRDDGHARVGKPPGTTQQPTGAPCGAGG